MNFLRLIFLFIALNCQTKKDDSIKKNNNPVSNIYCIDSQCSGTYQGPEFINGEDIAHQFSNQMSTAVGNQLKKSYSLKDYKMVDFEHIKMSTSGMNSGFVTYELTIPFVFVGTPCEAFTSFDHSGGWGHTPAIENRKMELQKALMPGQQLTISPLKTTPEGLQEYWIQWKNKDFQKGCQ